MTTSATSTGSSAPPTRPERIALAREAYSRFADLAARVPPEGWGRPTDCAGWTVRDLVGHMVGAMRSASSLREMASQQREINRRARRDRDADPVDIMTAVQVELAAGLSEADLVAQCRALVDPATRGRRRTPAPLRRLVRFPVLVGGVEESWRLGYLVDVVLTRDAWLHRVDLARALGVAPVLTRDHDARIVADVVAEWGRRHGRPARLHLTGPAGGRYLLPDSTLPVEPIEPVRPADVLTMDAVEFCRVLSGRAPGDGLLATPVPF